MNTALSLFSQTRRPLTAVITTRVAQENLVTMVPVVVRAAIVATVSDDHDRLLLFLILALTHLLQGPLIAALAAYRTAERLPSVASTQTQRVKHVH